MNNLSWKGKPLFTDTEINAFRKALNSLDPAWLDELGYTFRRELMLREQSKRISSPQKKSSRKQSPHKQLEKFTQALRELNRTVTDLQESKTALYFMINESYEAWQAFSAMRDTLRKNSDVLEWLAIQANSKIQQNRNPKGGRPKGSVSDSNQIFIENLLRYFQKYRVKTSKQGAFIKYCVDAFQRLTDSSFYHSDEAFIQAIKRAHRRIMKYP